MLLNDKWRQPLDPLSRDWSPRGLLDTVIHEYGHAAGWQHPAGRTSKEYQKQVDDSFDKLEDAFIKRRYSLCGG
jgi:hypothetical protein